MKPMKKKLIHSTFFYNSSQKVEKLREKIFATCLTELFKNSDKHNQHPYDRPTT